MGRELVQARRPEPAAGFRQWRALPPSMRQAQRCSLRSRIPGELGWGHGKYLAWGLRGHAYQVVALNNTSIHGAIRDTVLVPPMGRVLIAFDAENAGRWALHCHNMYHMAAGMMTEIRYADVV